MGSRVATTAESKKKRARFCIVRVTLGLIVCSLAMLATAVASTPLPPELKRSNDFDSSVRVLDRHGVVMAEVRANDGARARWVRLEEMPPSLIKALIAAEDRRFFVHPGVDPSAILRAAAQNIWHRRIVSGGSTITQQLARTLVPRARTFTGKLKEVVIALRIEASLSKHEILEGYLNLVTFGPSLRGVEAASRFYFDKPLASLSLAEVAALAAMPRGPSLYDPRSAPGVLEARRNRILARMHRAGWASTDEMIRAKTEPFSVYGGPTGWSAPHLVRGLLLGKIHPELGDRKGRVSTLRTTLDARLQREAQTAARSVVSSLRDRHVTAAAVVVLDNASGDVLAWVGAPDFFDEEHLGQNDGVLALRQPGSTLKPFVYSVAMEDLGWTAATVIPDVELHLPSDQGAYSPRNYDGRFHGPVRLREALANSYNVPAVYTAAAVGPARVLERLRGVGLRSLDQNPDHYGAAIALGDGEVRLVDLANAYATLARGGNHRPIRALIGAQDNRGQAIAVGIQGAARVMPKTISAILLDILADPHARLDAFGRGSAIEMPFPVAAKTGTSKGFRDNLTVGVTSEVTVAAWVGNFDGSPMQGVSGITGAGPLFRAVIAAATKGRETRPFAPPPQLAEKSAVCALSGERPTSACSHRVSEVFSPGTSPQRPCAMHGFVELDRRNGLRAGPSCPRSEVRSEVFELFESRYTQWARAARRSLPPSAWSPRCPGEASLTESHAPRAPRVRYPYDGATYTLDPSLPLEGQGVVVRAEAPAHITKLRFVVDGKTGSVKGPPFEHVVRLTRGMHSVHVETLKGNASKTVRFEVK